MASNRIRVGNKLIGEGEPVFVIGEAGSNHDGNLGKAKKLVEAAAEAGADAVKFQLFKADKVYVKNAGRADYLRDKRSMNEILKKMELPVQWIGELMDCSKENGLIFFSSVLSEEAVDALTALEAPAFKIPSYELTHLPLVKYAASKGRPVIMSTGMATLQEVREAVETVYSTGNRQLALMHCIGAYPAPLEQCNLNAIKTMQKEFLVPVGYSDHTLEPADAPALAVALGASLVEKHFTLSKQGEGPDHKYALEPSELKQMVQEIRRVEKMGGKEKQKMLEEPGAKKILGNGVLGPQPAEKELREFARRFIYAVKEIREGEEFTEQNIAVLRSGKAPHGLEPRNWWKVLGRKAARNVAAGEPIDWETVVTHSHA
jgi:N-acetylneuraminate synthase